jgi:hypothetical protein|tara:strand:- start:284 stop:946 length:663 start_codon:yes stop_codon:yes gene_type:complete
MTQYVISLNVNQVTKGTVGMLLKENNGISIVQYGSLVEEKHNFSGPVSCASTDIEKFDIGLVGKRNPSESEKSKMKCDECGKSLGANPADCRCYEFKVCDRCNIFKEKESNFQINQRSKYGVTFRPSCNDCRDLKDGKKMSSEELRKAEKTRPSGLWPCPICEKTYITEMMASPPRRDHDHATGKFRDWICDSCNTGLGRFDDNTIVLEDAIEYLKKDYS